MYNTSELKKGKLLCLTCKSQFISYILRKMRVQFWVSACGEGIATVHISGSLVLKTTTTEPNLYV